MNVRKDYGPKDCAGALVLLVGALLFLGFGVGKATAQTDTDPVPAACRTIGWTTEVANRPDSSAFGNWATDTFTRTTSVYCNTDGTYGLKLTDSGTFLTTGPLSPGAGVPLLPGVTGSFTGSFSVTVTSAVAPVQPPTTHDGSLSSSEWYQLLWPDGTGTVTATGAWGWTYSRCDGTDRWVNGSAGNTGDVTGITCVVVPPPVTTTTPPVITTTTTTAPATGTSSDTKTTVAPAGVTYKNCSEAPANLLRGEPGYEAKLDGDGNGVACESSEVLGEAGSATHVKNEGLAYTGTSSAVGWLLLSGVGAVLIGGAALVIVRKRRKLPTVGEFVDRDRDL